MRPQTSKTAFQTDASLERLLRERKVGYPVATRMFLTEGAAFTADATVLLEHVLFALSTFMVFVFNFSAGVGSTLTNLIIVFFAGYEIVIAASKRRRKVLSVPFASLVVFMVLCFDSVLYSRFPDMSLGKSMTMLQLVFYAAGLSSYFAGGGARRMRFAFFCIMASGVCSATYLIAAGDWESGERLNKIIGDSNTAGAYLSFAATMAFWALKTRRVPRLPAYGILALMTFAVLVNGSRSVLISYVMGLLLLQIVYRRQRGRVDFKKLVGLAGVLAFIALICWLAFHNDLFYEILGRRIQSVFEILQGKESNIHEGSMTGRLDLIGYAFAEFAAHPFLGIGLNAFSGTYGYFAHNDFLELLACMGAIGFAVFYLPYVAALRNAWSGVGKERYLIFVLLVQIAITHCFVVFYYQKLEMLFIAFLYAVSRIGMGVEEADGSPDAQTAPCATRRLVKGGRFHG